ncbi:MAG TPA: 4Fe-4S dicluster domain-containing protein, partial [Chloroflexota bacterium]|nr:4Fe-4S dicluster domain-containing protein [Chloroflexota bacterium]
YLPALDDYYEPWSYRYRDLIDAPPGDDQPTARPISMVTDRYLDIEAGPNWDDDLGGSPVYAANDPALVDLTAEERRELFQLERLNFFYIPRICNHCLNPGCVAACPSGALYKRGEDGIVLVSQEKCRGWRFCVSGCPYKKVYYNWTTGKSEKCILCYPRQEVGLAPACFHACVGRIRYLGPVLYNAEDIEYASSSPDNRLVDAHRNLILDPFDPEVIAEARANGIHDRWILAAQRSPVYKLIKLWRIALPLRDEFRTMPMLFYVPPLLPVMASVGERGYNLEVEELFAGLEQSRIPFRYLARLFGAGNREVVREALAKLVAVRVYMRSKTVGDVRATLVQETLREAGLAEEEAEAIFRLTTVPGPGERHAVPPYQREMAIQESEAPNIHRGETGLGTRQPPWRRF